MLNGGTQLWSRFYMRTEHPVQTIFTLDFWGSNSRLKAAPWRVELAEREADEWIGSSEFLSGARRGQDCPQVLHTVTPSEDTISQQIQVYFSTLGAGRKSICLCHGPVPLNGYWVCRTRTTSKVPSNLLFSYFLS